ncbi:TonB-dependent receptor [Sphingopyxis sp. EG6]|uniref:TonB-dependent receptor n=1 Tax=Sphingopyxis sp. EG6 TaxID=1874061 RepID=UPI000DC61C5A|nr:TonB-dependent receptor [Sphingopyxis sp. EG6]BBB09050.1 TonB-dependent receptor [Sphingopyxis sp. EG6]
MNKAFFLTGSIVALAVATSAQAQEGVDPTDRAVGGEIVVTAQKREQRLTDVPSAISVVGAEDLEQFQAASLTDIAAKVPGLQVDSGGTPGQATVTLRGIAALGASTTVGTYIDEAPIGSSSIYARSGQFAADLLPYDLERIEILKGPQGTLYGASSIGGLLKYVTRDPDLNRSEYRAGGDVFDIASSGDLGYSGRVGVNLPVVEGKLALRASYSYRATPGFVDNVSNGDRDINDYSQQSARVAALWQASPDFSLEFAGLWQKVKADGYGETRLLIPEPYLSGTAPIPPGALQPLGDGRSTSVTLPSLFENELLYLTATAKADLGFADFVSATSYSDSRTYQYGDFTDVYGPLIPLLTGGPGLSAFYITLDLQKFTQEFRFSTADGGAPFQWLIGGFYTHEKSGNQQVVTAQNLDRSPIAGLDPLATAGLPSTYDEYAVFGQASYTFADVFEIGGGLRWARNEQDFRQISDSAAGLVPTADDPGSSSEEVVTWSGFARYAIAPRASLYARVATGYRPGGPNVILPNIPTSVGSDRLTNYELGVKADILDNRASIEASVFQMDWTDIQLSVSTGGVSHFDNAGSARARGVEIGASIRPDDRFSVGLNAAYTHAKLLDDAPGGNGLAGDRLPAVPKFSASITPQYDFPLGGDWTGSIATSMRFVGDRYSATPSSANAIKLPDYTAFDLSLRASNERWTAQIYVRNLTDNRGLLSGAVSTSAFGTRNYVTAVPIQPRTIGLAVDFKY